MTRAVEHGVNSVKVEKIRGVVPSADSVWGEGTIGVIFSPHDGFHPMYLPPRGRYMG